MQLAVQRMECTAISFGSLKISSDEPRQTLPVKAAHLVRFTIGEVSLYEHNLNPGLQNEPVY